MLIKEVQQNTFPVLLPGLSRGSLEEGEAGVDRPSHSSAVQRAEHPESYTNAPDARLKKLSSTPHDLTHL